MPRQVSVDVRRAGRAHVCIGILLHYIRKPWVITSVLLVTCLCYVTINYYGTVISPSVYRHVLDSSPSSDVTSFTSRHIEVISWTDYEAEAGWAVANGAVDMEALRRRLQEAVTEVYKERRSHDLLRLNITSLGMEPEVVIDRCRKWVKPATNVNVTSRASVILLVNDASVETVMTSFFALMKNTPLSTVEEVLVVGGARSLEYVLEVLVEVMDILPHLRVFRFDKVTDDFKLMITATRFARSEAIIFLKAKVKVMLGWIHPLLAHLASHPESVVFPNLVGKQGDVHTEDGLRMRMELALDFSTVWERRPSGNVTSLSSEDFLSETLVPDYGMALTRTLFHDVREFDEFHGAQAFGNELTAFSLKVILCKGDIVRAACSNVAVTSSTVRSSTANVQPSLAFRYLGILAELWFHDSYTHARTYKCLLPRSRNTSLSYHARRTVQNMRKWMTLQKCRPIATLATTDRPLLRVPESSATHAGRVHLRGNDAMELALGDDMRTLAFRPQPAYLTSPFSLTEERFILNRKCIAMEETAQVVLTTCRHGDRRQRWVNTDQTLRPWSNQTLCLGMARSPELQQSQVSTGGSQIAKTAISVPARMFPCNDTSAVIKFTFSFEFDPKCRK